MTQAETQSENKLKTKDEVKVAVIACARSVNLEGELSATKLNGVSNCDVIQVPCSGMIQPRMIEAAFNAGADGVIAMGCQIGDCHFREGNKFCRERLLGQRPPMIKKTVPKRRLKGLWMSEVQVEDFKARVEDFKGYVAEQLVEEQKGN
ncbi:MAG: hydrogenase iron-sulfur subunit [Candidatus Melainabacteria bacterium]|jgi:coenzyme F420-reducing hydrogenase delta subunit|nr:hydrogenase iron-sulfur subunit [Candidatus Melainabacteria bacterium]